MKNPILGFLKNTWTVTLVATLLGVYGGVYLNNLNSQRTLNQNKERALQSIKSEIENNQEILQNHLDSLERYYDPLSWIFANLDEEGELTVSREAMQAFQQRSPDMLLLTDSIALPDGLMNYSGELNFHWPLLSVGLSDIAWSTFKDTGLSATMDFDCLYLIATYYKLLEEIKLIYGDWQSLIFGDFENREEILKQWRFLIAFEEKMISFYEKEDFFNVECK